MIDGRLFRPSLVSECAEPRSQTIKLQVVHIASLASTFSLSESRKPDVLAEDSPNKCSLLEVITDLRIKLGCVVNWDFASKDKRIILPRLVQYFMFHGQKVPMSPRNLQICVVTNAAQRAADGYRR